MAWIDDAAPVMDELGAAAEEISAKAAEFRAAIERAHGAFQGAIDRLAAALEAAAQLPSVNVSREADRHWQNGLRRWEDARDAFTVTAREAPRAARALDAGTDEFLRAAEAFRRAQG